MVLFKLVCWDITFIIRLCFLPGSLIAAIITVIILMQCIVLLLETNKKTPKKQAVKHAVVIRLNQHPESVFCYCFFHCLDAILSKARKSSDAKTGLLIINIGLKATSSQQGRHFLLLIYKNHDWFFPIFTIIYL